jgi:hypothetical protein
MAVSSYRVLATIMACVLLANFALLLAPGVVRADEAVEKRIARLEDRVDDHSHSVQIGGDDGAVLFLFGVFCALWAQNTNRNAWLWFFLGLCFSVVTVLVLLAKNSEDRKLKRRAEAADFG